MNTLSLDTRKHLTAGSITLLVATLMFLLFYFIQYKFPIVPPPVEEMGMLVNLGDSEDGSGDVQPLADNTDNASTASSAASKAASSTTQPQSIETQTNEDAASVESSKNKNASKPLDKKPDEKAIQKAKDDAIAKIEADKKVKEIADEKKKADFKNKLKNALNKSNDSKSEGLTHGSGDQGVPDGDPNATNHVGQNTGPGTAGNGWSIKGLKGRVARTKPFPKDDSKDVGKIAINITVDKNGNVIKATYTEKGSTSSSTALIKASIKAAKEWKFNEKIADNDETGTLIFNFQNR